MLIALLVPLSLAIVAFAAILLRAVISKRAQPTPEAIVLGAVTNFFDTLGIGSFAPTMAWLKFRKLVPDRLIPPTMLVGHSLPTMAQAVIFLMILGVLVDPVLLVGCMIALLMGGLLGAPLVARTRVWFVQLAVAVALLVAGILYAVANLKLMPGGGIASSLPLWLTIAAIAVNFVFGVLINFGIGHYAPSLILFSLMGLDPKLIFPIMAGGGGLMVAGAGVRHIGLGQIDLRIVTGIAIGGIPAVLVAAFIVKNMPVDTLRWLVAGVVLYASAVMFRSALIGRREHSAQGATIPVTS
jgi:uncharacterized membrane protein YfcA